MEQGIEEGRERWIKEGKKEGIREGIKEGSTKTLAKNVESAMKNFGIDLEEACQGLGTSVKEYETAKKCAALSEKDEICHSADSN